MLQQLIQPLLFSTAGILVLWVLFSLNAKTPKKGPVQVFKLLFLIYLGWVVCFVLYPIPMTLVKTTSNGEINLVPVTHMLQDYHGAFEMMGYPIRQQFYENYVGNIILFVPFGFFLPLISRFKTFGNIVIAAILFSVLIETLQFFARYVGVYRSVDIDDVLLNTAGAITGYFIFIIVRSFIIKPKIA